MYTIRKLYTLDYRDIGGRTLWVLDIGSWCTFGVLNTSLMFPPFIHLCFITACHKKLDEGFVCYVGNPLYRGEPSGSPASVVGLALTSGQEMTPNTHPPPFMLTRGFDE